MQIFHGLKKLKKFKKPVVVLGVFDGVHLAHRRILREAAGRAHSIKGSSILVTFYPHPQKEESLYSLGHRLKLISSFGIDAAVVIRFNKKFSRIPARNFIKDVLVKRFKPEYVFVGENFTFGRGAQGNCRLLKEASAANGFRLKVFPVLKIKQKAISSTLIRRLIKDGKLAQAEKLLRRRVSVLGTVVRGASLARKLGFPTANIDPHHEVLPPAGVYSVKVLYRQKVFFGVCSIGHKPTFNTKSLQHIEVHIFNFKRNIYGAYLEIQFIKHLRKQKKFSSLPALAAQIKKDVILAKRALCRR